MTERPMDDLAPMAEDPHPDEGAIHAWIEQQLGVDDAERVESHVRYCRACQARVEEARELMAASSRVVASLDDPARPFVAAQGDEVAAARVRAGSSSLWRWARLTPARAALAASLLVALGVTLTQRRVTQDVAPSVKQAMVATAPMAVPLADHVLDSAVARRVVESQPQRTVEAAPGEAMPTPSAPLVAGQLVQSTAGAQVAQGRAASRTAREASPVAADQSRAGAAAVSASPANATAPPELASRVVTADLPVAKRPMAAKASDGASGSSGAMSAAPVTRARTVRAAPQECYVIEPARREGSSWGSLALPVVVEVVGSAVAGAPPRPAFVARDGDTTMLSWATSSRDSVQVRPGDVPPGTVGFGTLELGPGADRRTGIARTSAESSGVSVRTARGPRPASRAVDVIARRVVCPGS